MNLKREKKVDPIEAHLEVPDPPGFEEWPVLDRIEYRMKTMTKRITIGDAARTRLSKALKQQRWIFGLSIAALVIAFGAVGWNSYTNGKDAKATCESGNKRLIGTRADKMEENKLSQASAETQGLDDPENPIRVYYDDLLDWRLDELYPLRDCEHLDKQIELPADPPSFEDALVALQEYLKEQDG